MMRVEQLHGADLLLTNNAGDAGEREFQFFRLRRGGEEQASLRRARTRRFRGEMNLHNRCPRRMRVQIELQEFQENLGVEHGQRKI